MRTDAHKLTKPDPRWRGRPRTPEQITAEQETRKLQTRKPEKMPIGNTHPLMATMAARMHTVAAVQKLVDLMEGRLPKDTALSDGQGVPAAVQLRAAELIIERGYGKSPQAILLRDDSSANSTSTHAIPIMERIAQLKAARDQLGSVTDLEASEVTSPSGQARVTDVSATPVSSSSDQAPILPDDDII
jgi:hypothetical protein